MTALVVASDLKRTYEIRRGWLRKPAQLHAVGGVSFDARSRPARSRWSANPVAASRRSPAWSR